MSRLTQTLSIVTALLSGGVYDTGSASPTTTTTSTRTPVVQTIDIDDESRRIMMDAQIAMGTELKRK